MDIEHIIPKEAYIAKMKMRILKEQSSNNLQKLNRTSNANLDYIFLLGIYKFTLQWHLAV